MAEVAYVTHTDYERHVQGPAHPERPERIRALFDHLPTTAVWSSLRAMTPDIAPVDVLEYVHTSSYIDLIEYQCRHGGGLVDGVETGTVAESFTIARRAVGAVTMAVDAVLAHDAPKTGFCAVRPPGHHALPDRAMGFCLFNNTAIGARYAQKRHGVERVFIVDWDYHHGNGTQAIFWTDPSVFYFSVHCFPAYPGTGRQSETGDGAGQGFTLNAPLPPRSQAEDYFEVFDEVLAPAVESFSPDLIIIAAGFDAHRDDPISHMLLDGTDFRTLTRRVKVLAEAFCDGRIVSVLEGGYDTRALALSVEEHLIGLAE